MSKPTLGLAMITNDAEATIKILERYGEHFDEWFITVADKAKNGDKELKRLLSWYERNKNSDHTVIKPLRQSYFKWQDNFGLAREYNRNLITTDYFMWIDSDDIIENPENIRTILGQMVAQDLDAVYMKYDYIKNDLGEGIGDHWRERIVKTNHFKWAQTRVHETLIAPAANTSRTDLVTILHNKDKKAEDASMQRNIKLLLQDFKETQDPRIAMYLGDNLMYLKMYDQALEYLAFLVQNGGWDEDKYRAWLRVAEIHFQCERHDAALAATDKALGLLPDFPDAYFLKASIYNALQEPKKVYEWVKVGMMKPAPETLSVVDPTLYEYRGIFMGALAALELGKVEEAHKLLQIVLQRSPNYELAVKMQPLFDEAFYDNKAVGYLKWLAFYLKDNGGDGAKLLSALPSKLLADPRLNYVRSQFFRPVKWPKKSIAFYCGPAAETWGPDTLEKGMGGSEEAIVYLSRELAKQGWQVTVFNDREEEYTDPSVDWNTGDWEKERSAHDVTYRPWTLLNPKDEFDVFVAWRAPENAHGVNARKKLVDLHDVVEPERVYTADKDITFLVKSQYHRNLYHELPDDRFVVVGNGIVKEQFND